MQRVEGSFVGGGDARIVYDAWAPDGAVTGTVVLVHGMGEHARRYDHVVARLGELGLAVYAPDHRGHGRSTGRRLYLRRIAECVEDLEPLFAIAAERHPDRQPFLVGHSLGAMIALAYALEHPDGLRGLALSGTPLVPGDGVSRPAIAVARFIGRVAPAAPLQALNSAYISRDPAVVARYEEDPLVYRGKIPAGLGGAMLTTMDDLKRRLPALTVPTLVLHGGADRLVDPAGSRLIAERAGSTDLELRVYDGLYHEIFNEPEQDLVLTDLTEWLRKRL